MFFKPLRILLILLISWPCVAVDMVFVVNANNKSEFSQAQIMQLYLRKTERFSDGVAANLYHLPRGSVEHQQFCLGLMNLSAHQYQSYWSRLLFTGNVSAMMHLTHEQLVEKVAQDEAAIGYLPASINYQKLRAVAILRDRQIEMLNP